MASQELNWRPKAKREGLLVEEIDGEVLVYNLERHRAHCLNDTAVRVWNLCTGKRTVEQIASELNIALDPASRIGVVRDTVARFERLGLVETAEGATPSMSRRKFVQRVGIGVAAGVALPLVTSIVAPTPAYAASGLANGKACTTSAQCASKCCCNDNSGGNSGKCVAGTAKGVCNGCK
jgi:hypothetical protein